MRPTDLFALPRPRLVLAFLVFALAGCGHDRIAVPHTMIFLPADGRTHTALTLRRKSGRELAEPSIEDAPSGLQFEQDGPDRVSVVMRSPVMPGRKSAYFAWHGQRYSLTFQFAPATADSFGDGLPDALRLHSAEDRRAFRSWFTAVAEQEASLPADKVPAEINDCAALLRFCYREALVQHDSQWFAAQPFPDRFASLVSISQYHYPATPLGPGLFRIKPGAYEPDDATNGAFAQFADAHALFTMNAHWIGRDVHTALPGDLLFFRQLEQNSPYHSMIVTGATSDWVIYDTGPIGRQKGETRRVSMQDLLHHPDARWRPVPENTNFLGVYRWNVLRGGD